MSMMVGETETYTFAVDADDVPRPPDQIITSGDPVAAQRIQIKCMLRAQLSAVDGKLTVKQPQDAIDGWVYREFSPDGVATWAWDVEANAMGEAQLKVSLSPAVRSDEIPLASSVQDNTRNVPFVTKVDIDGTAADRASNWMNEKFPQWKAIATTLGAGVLAFLAWLVVTKTELLKLRTTSTTTKSDEK